MKSSTCIDSIFTNAEEMCLKAVSRSIGCCNHNIVSISRKNKVPKAGPNIVYKRSYKKFCSDFYVVDVNNICCSFGCNEEQTDVTLDTFMKLLMPVTNKHAPIKKMTVKTVKFPWIDEELNNFMVEREEAKGIANNSGFTTDWQTYCKLRNHVTKLNKKKKKIHTDK